MPHKKVTAQLNPALRAGLAKISAHMASGNPPTMEPPKRIRYTSRLAWGGAQPGSSGMHVQVVEMMLDKIENYGPHYITTKVISDEGGPPIRPRSPTTYMGVSWHAIKDQIARGVMVVLADNEDS